MTAIRRSLVLAALMAGNVIAAEVQTAEPVRLLCIGNSITRHGPAPKIGWTNDWGMAASSIHKDYAHLLAQALQKKLGRPVRLHLQNLAGFERNLATYDLEKSLAGEIAWKPDYVVIALGENAAMPTNAAMRTTYRTRMADLMRMWQTRVGSNLVVRGPFYPPAVKDSLMRAAAMSVGAKYAYTADLSKNPANKALGLFQHPGVAGHPGDRGMAALAERIFEALFPAPLPSWKGSALAAWKPNEQIRDLKIEGDSLVGTATGYDAQFCLCLDRPFLPRGNQRFSFRLKVPVAGNAQLFWTGLEDAGPSEERQITFPVVGDGQWHDYAIAPSWCASTPVRALRFDLPSTMTGKPFAIADMRLETVGPDKVDLIDADGVRGVAFSLREPKGLHYGRLSWAGEKGSGFYSFSTAPDGERHDYWLDLRQYPSRYVTNWKGIVGKVEVKRFFTDEDLPVENLRFLDRKPDTPADPVITSAYPEEALQRAGRPFPVEVIVRNYGTRPAENLVFAFEGLPAGVRLHEPAALAPAEPLPGCDGTETIDNDCRVPLAHERIYRFTFDDLGVGTHAFAVTLRAKGVAPRRVTVRAEVKPSLGLAKADYPAEPKPVDTAPYEIGALLFPGWVNHKWHAVWTHAPERKPLLGWYDETKPETIDWQIKHLVENGVSFVSVDWYWHDGKLLTHHWMDAFAKARFRKYLKWHVMWDNGFNSASDQEKLTTFWCTNYFGDVQYHKIGGKPVVSICNPYGMERAMAGKGGARKLIEITQRIAREHGFPGVYFVAMRGMGQDFEDAAFLGKFADMGFDLTTVYGFRGGIGDTPYTTAKRRPFPWLADVSPAHWRALAKNSTLPFWPSLSTGYDDRPWRGERVLEIYDYNVKDFRRICETAKVFSDESGIRTFLMGPLDEWGEGSIGYPNRELGFGILEAVRDTFGHKPVEGWPVNYAPEDIAGTSTEYFVDSESGKDTNDGLSPATAWRTLAKVNGADIRPGDTVRFRRGGLWRGQLVPRSGEPGRPVTYTTYGTGAKPILQNSVDRSKPSDWVPDKPGLWSTRQSVPTCHEQAVFPSEKERWNGHFEGGMKGTVMQVTENGETFWRVTCTARGPKAGPNCIQLWGPALRGLPDTSVLRFRVRSSKPFDLTDMQVMNNRYPYARLHAMSMKAVRQVGTAWTPVQALLKRKRPDLPDVAPLFHLNLGDSLPAGASLDVKFDGVWRAEVDRTLNIPRDVGIFIVNHGERWGVKKWNRPGWEVPARGSWPKSVRMEDELDYWYDDENGRVVVKCQKNPGEAFGSIELALTEHVVNEGGKHDVTYDGLWVRYGAAHGFGGGGVANLVIRNCDICWIGGGLQFWKKDEKTGKIRYPVRFGNGIEFWGNCRNCLIERCRLWEVYDAALTNQGRDDRETEITWRDNVIWNSEYSYEYWNRGVTRNVLFEHNTCVDAGRGWAHAQRPDPNGAHLMYYHNRAATTNFVVRDNVFCRATEWTARSGLDWRSGLTHDHNLVYNDGGVPVMRWLDGKPLKLCSWKDYLGLGFDPHGQFAEPLFRNPAKRDYRLRADSPGLTLGSDGQTVGARNMPGLDEDQSLR